MMPTEVREQVRDALMQDSNWEAEQADRILDAFQAIVNSLDVAAQAEDNRASVEGRDLAAAAYVMGAALGIQLSITPLDQPPE